MKVKEFEQEAHEERNEWNVRIVKEILKERIDEIKRVRVVLAKLERQYDRLLEMDVDELIMNSEMSGGVCCENK